MKITSEDIEWFKEAQKIINRGYYPNGKKAIEDYNRIFEEEIAKGTYRGNLTYKCGSCIREAVIKVNQIINKLVKETESNEEGTEKKDKGT